MSVPFPSLVRRGFSMLELAVVIVVTGILIGAFISPASTLVIGMRQSAAAAEVEREIIAARSRAVAEGRPVGIFITSSSVNGTFSAIASAAGVAASTHALYPIELSSTTTGSVQISTSIADQLSSQGTYSLSSRFTGVQITSITGGTSGGTAIWFASDGKPELRTLSGTRTGAQSGDVDILLNGGTHIYVRALSGLVEVQ